MKWKEGQVGSFAWMQSGLAALNSTNGLRFAPQPQSIWKQLFDLKLPNLFMSQFSQPWNGENNTLHLPFLPPTAIVRVK